MMSSRKLGYTETLIRDMLHERLLEAVAEHAGLLDRTRGRFNPGDVLGLCAVLHALQTHAQATIDYPLHTYAPPGTTMETPLSCVAQLQRRGLILLDKAEMLRRLVRLAVHGYSAVDPDKVAKMVESRGYHAVLQTIYRLHRRLAEEGLLDP